MINKTKNYCGKLFQATYDIVSFQCFPTKQAKELESTGNICCSC